MPRYTSEPRQLHYAYIQQLRRKRIITAEEYQAEKAKLDAREAKAEANRMAREARIAQVRAEKARARAVALAERVERRKLERAEKRLAGKALRKTFNAKHLCNVSDLYPPEDQKNNPQYLYGWLKANRPNSDFSVVVQRKLTEDDEWETLVMVSFMASDELSFHEWFDMFKGALMSEEQSWATKICVSGFMDTQEEPFDARVVILPYVGVKAERIVTQHFKEGERNCVFAPAGEFWREHAKTMKSDVRRKMCMTYAKRCDEYALKFHDSGVSAAELEAILPRVGLTMKICSLLMETNQHIAKTTKEEGNRVCLHYVNSASNHLELMESNKPLPVTADEMGALFREALKGCCAYRRSNRVAVPTWLNNGKGEYKLVNDCEDILTEFGKSVGLQHYKFDVVENKSLWKFLHNAICSGAIAIPSTYTGEYVEFDKTQAYARFWTNPYYDQFKLPASLHHFRDLRQVEEQEEFIVAHPGIYRCIVWDIPAVAQRFGMVDGGLYTFYSPVWKWLLDRGARISLQTGAYGSVCDWRFTQDMVEKRMPSYKGRKGASLYSVYVGRLMQKCDEMKTIVKTDLQMIQHLKAGGYNIHRFDKDEKGGVYAEVIQKKSSSYTAIHQGIAIRDYTILHTLMEAEKFSADDVIGLHLDALLLKPSAKAVDGEYRVKRVTTGELRKCMELFAEAKVVSSDNDDLGFTTHTLLLGAGGTGKTEGVMRKGSGYVSPLYTSKAWRQCVSKRQQYGRKAFCMNNLLGIDAVGEKTISFLERFKFVPPVIFADEMTQWPVSWLDDLRRIFPYSLVLGAGDYDEKGRPFQTSETGIVKLPNWPRVWFKTDYRAMGSQKLIDMKRDMRDFMSANYGRIGDLLRWAVETYKDRVVDKEYVVNTIGCDDWLLCTTRNADDSQTKQWTARICEARPDLPLHHLVVKHSISDVMLRIAGDESYLKGDIIPMEIPGRTEPRHAYTIHAVQGETIRGKVFIDIRGMFDYSALYTAVSRATEYENVFLVV